MQSQIGSSRQRGLCLVHIVDQTQNFEVMFQVLHSIFILINKEEGSLKQSRSWKFLDFCCWLQYIDAKLIFVTPTYGTWYIQKGVHL